MKAPSLLLLLAVVAAPAAPAFAEGPAHRCDVDWLNKAKSSIGVTIDDKNKYLTTVAGQAPTIDITNPTKLCDATVWHYLAVLEPVSDIIDQKTHLPIGGLRLHWNDPALQAQWATGRLENQIQILLDADARYQRIDALGRDALTKAEAVVKAAETAGVAKRADVAGPAALKKLGYTGDAYVEDKGYTVAALPADAVSAAPQEPAALKAAFLQVLDDDNLPAKPKPKPVKGKPTPAVPAVPLKYKPGTAVVAFRKSVVALANEVRSARPDAPKAAFADADYDAAVKFVTSSAIAKGDESGAYPEAALSTLDYGLRNLIALRAAAVAKSVEAAQGRVGKTTTVAAALAGLKPDQRLPANQTSADMAKAVLRHMQGVDDYKDLNTLYDREAAHPESQWMKDNGEAVRAQLKAYHDDADATKVVIDKNTKGPALQYSIGQQKVTDSGIAVADLDKSQGYRETIAEAIAQNIATAPLNAKVQAALAAFRLEGTPGAPAKITPPLTPEQNGAAALLPPVQPAIVVAAPASGWDALAKASPAQGALGRFFNPKGDATRYYSKMSEEAAGEAEGRTEQRTAVEDAANTAADVARERAAAARRQIARAHPNPDDSAELAAQKKAAALAEFDKNTKTEIAAARQKVIDDAIKAKRYADAATIAADLKKKQDALDATVDAAYSDGVAKAVAKLNAEYDLKGSPRRRYAERQSGYEGSDAAGPFYKTERVDAYFKKTWTDDPNAISTCKGRLGFKKGGDSSDFKDPSPDNVDAYCGVRDGLVANLITYKGTNKKAAPAPAPVPPK